MKRRLISCAVLLLTATLARSADDIVIADFEGETYGDWKTTGAAFGTGPAHGAVGRQKPVTGFSGMALANSFHKGDRSVGTLTSPAFKIERSRITFLIGGGGFPDTTCMNLLVDGKVVRTATGQNTGPGGKENLALQSWDVSEFIGKEAVLEIVDRATGGWGHIMVDQIVQTDAKAAVLKRNVTRQMTVTHRFLRMPVKNDAPTRGVTIIADGKPAPGIAIQLADGTPDWWAWKDMSAYKGKEITIQVNSLPENSAALSSMDQSDTIAEPANLYREPLRPQFHFSSARGWLNDPNGLVYYKGEYHLFYQHNPYGWNWGNMHWGHAVSRDLVHWKQLGEALEPDAMGVMFSGSGIVDKENVSGLGKKEDPALLLFYTARAKKGGANSQCIAHSQDGRRFTKYNNNPVVTAIGQGDRDPKVVWHEPSKRWIMVLYAGIPTGENDEKGKPKRTHAIYFLNSSDLKHWTQTSHVEGIYECPDFFELPVDGNAANKKWVLTGADSDYLVGSFDGTTFTPETGKVRGKIGKTYYAAQSFSDIPDGRRISIGWMRADSPGMAFNQSMSLPAELKLVSTPEGPRLTWTPVKELATLRGKASSFRALTLTPGSNPLANVNGELLEIRAKFNPGEAREVSFKVRGATVVYNTAQEEISVNGVRAKAPLRDGSQELAIYLDRTSIEVFADGGLVYAPLAYIPKASDTSISVSAMGGAAKIESLDVYPLRSAWE